MDGDASGRGGIVPDHRVPLDEAAFEAAYGQGRDVVLEAAVRWLGAAGHVETTIP